MHAKVGVGTNFYAFAAPEALCYCFMCHVFCPSFILWQIHLFCVARTLN